MQLQLTYIPPTYWMNPNTGFKILFPVNAPTPPRSSGFFMLWLPEGKGTETERIAQIEEIARKTFPQIPITKLMTAQIRLAFPIFKGEKTISEIKQIPITEMIGKVLPLPPAIKVLFRLPVSQPKQRDRRHTQPQYSDSVKSWAYLIKLTIELLNRGNFLPYLEPINEQEQYADGMDESKGSNYQTQTTQPTKFEGRWRVLLKTYRDHARYHALVQKAPWAAYNLPIQCLPGVNLDPNNQDSISFYKYKSP